MEFPFSFPYIHVIIFIWVNYRGLLHITFFCTPVISFSINFMKILALFFLMNLQSYWLAYKNIHWYFISKVYFAEFRTNELPKFFTVQTALWLSLHNNQHFQLQSNNLYIIFLIDATNSNDPVFILNWVDNLSLWAASSQLSEMID